MRGRWRQTRSALPRLSQSREPFSAAQATTPGAAPPHLDPLLAHGAHKAVDHPAVRDRPPGLGVQLARALPPRHLQGRGREGRGGKSQITRGWRRPKRAPGSLPQATRHVCPGQCLLCPSFRGPPLNRGQPVRQAASQPACLPAAAMPEARAARAEGSARGWAPRAPAGAAGRRQTGRPPSGQWSPPQRRRPAAWRCSGHARRGILRERKRGTGRSSVSGSVAAGAAKPARGWSSDCLPG